MISQRVICINKPVQSVDWATYPTPQAIITSPPYWRKRDYGIDDSQYAEWCGQLGQEPTSEMFIQHLTEVLCGLPLADDGVMWINIDDTYHKGRLEFIPSRLAIAINARGYFVRSQIIWHKTNPMPENCRNRPDGENETVLLISKRQSGYKYNYRAVTVQLSAKSLQNARGGYKASKYKGAVGCNAVKKDSPGRQVADNARRPLRNIWSISGGNNKYKTKDHFAPMPEELVRRCLLLSTDDDDFVLDPFAGSGTTMRIALTHSRRAIGVEIDKRFAEWVADLTEPRLL